VVEKANARQHRTLRCRPIDRLAEEREAMRALPAREPDVDRRWVTRVLPDPMLRFDTNDYSLDPALAGRRIDVRVCQREVIAVALDTGELACRHERSFARHRTVIALEHARALKQRRGEADREPEVEIRSLAVYDRLIA
jgi:Mu transposase, C-terminal domain